VGLLLADGGTRWNDKGSCCCRSGAFWAPFGRCAWALPLSAAAWSAAPPPSRAVLIYDLNAINQPGLAPPFQCLPRSGAGSISQDHDMIIRAIHFEVHSVLLDFTPDYSSRTAPHHRLCQMKHFRVVIATKYLQQIRANKIEEYRVTRREVALFKFLRLHFQPFGSTPTRLSRAERGIAT